MGNDGPGLWVEAEEAPVGAPLGDLAYIRWKRYPVLGWNLWHVMVCRSDGWAFVLQGAYGCFMRRCAVRVTAVVLYGYALWVCPLTGECPFCHGCSTRGHVRWVAGGYCMKPGGDPFLLVSGGGGNGVVIVGGDEVQ